MTKAINAKATSSRTIFYHSETGHKVRVLMRYGQVVRAMDLETNTAKSYHPSSLVDTYAETKKARFAGTQRGRHSKCKCGSIKSHNAIMCYACRNPAVGKTADKVCECGNRMGYKSKTCVECRIANNWQASGERLYDAPIPTDREAEILRLEEPGEKQAEADAIIAKYAKLMREGRINSGLVWNETATDGLSRLDHMTSGVFNTPGSDRRRGRA